MKNNHRSASACARNIRFHLHCPGNKSGGFPNLAQDGSLEAVVNINFLNGLTGLACRGKNQGRSDKRIEE
jgi:hypothetical protein